MTPALLDRQGGEIASAGQRTKWQGTTRQEVGEFSWSSTVDSPSDACCRGHSALSTLCLGPRRAGACQVGAGLAAAERGSARLQQPAVAVPVLLSQKKQQGGGGCLCCAALVVLPGSLSNR